MEKTGKVNDSEAIASNVVTVLGSSQGIWRALLTNGPSQYGAGALGIDMLRVWTSYD